MEDFLEAVGSPHVESEGDQRRGRMKREADPPKSSLRLLSCVIFL
jgi:hypothetical protein